MKIPKVAIIGRPNVGKSTLFNRLTGRRKAITSKIAGTTRDRVSDTVSWNGKTFLLYDTAGLVETYSDMIEERQIEESAQKQVSYSLKEADLILFLIDVRAGITPADEKIAKELQKVKEKVILVANKADSLKQEDEAGQLHEFSFEKIIPVSSISGRRTGALLDLITENISSFSKEQDSIASMSIVGRPNVGKSTLFNKLINKNLSIVSEVPGTTRDVVEAELIFNKEKKKIRLIDTAGIRKRGKIEKGVEKFSVLRAFNAVVNSDISLIVMNSEEGITRQDAHLVQMAIDNRNKIIIVLNKIDLLEDQSTTEVENMFRFSFINKQTVVAVSAKTGQNIDLLQREIANLI